MWSPRREADLASALESGELRESHLLEIKRIDGSGKAERSEMARDLASMALDGGQILFGLNEVKDSNSFELTPFVLQGRVEALEQIAELRIEPPLQIRATEIVSDSSPEMGYILVQIDASAEAPHMVDGVYYGRGEKRRRRLGDGEVQ